MRQPSLSTTGPVPVQPPADSVPVEQLVQTQKMGQQSPTANAPIQFLMMPQGQPNVNPGLNNAPPAAPPAATAGGK